jgi:hypothetical protein
LFVLFAIYLAKLLIWAFSPISNILFLCGGLIAAATVIYGIGFYYGFITSKRLREEKLTEDFFKKDK